MTFAYLPDLLTRLSRADQKTTYVFGSGVALGAVPGVAEVVAMIRDSLPSSDRVALNVKVASAPRRAYQVAFRHVHSVIGPGIANEIIRQAVLGAYKGDNRAKLDKVLAGDIDVARSLEHDLRGWKVPPALEAFARFAAKRPTQVGSIVLTTNFDPLVEIALRKQGLRARSVAITSDGGIPEPEPDEITVVHLHGLWWGDTMHTPAQLEEPRRALGASLRRIVGKSALCVVGYGGWEDALMRALAESASDARSELALMWTFVNEKTEEVREQHDHVLNALSDARAKGRVVFYCGVRAERLFAELQPPRAEPFAETTVVQSRCYGSSVGTPRVAEYLAPHYEPPYILQRNFQGRFEERSRLSEWWKIEADRDWVLSIVGLGGEGKSSLAWVWLQQDLLGEGDASTCLPQPEAVMWFSFYEPGASFDRFLLALWRYLCSKADSDSRGTWKSVISEIVGVLRRRKTLVILDGFERALNAYAVDARSGAAKASRRHRGCRSVRAKQFWRTVSAHAMPSRILLTSRLQPVELEDLQAASRFELKMMSTEDARAFLEAQGVRGTVAEIDALLESYGTHALRLRLLAGIIANHPSRRGDAQVALERSLKLSEKQRDHHVLEWAYDSLSDEVRGFLSTISAVHSGLEVGLLFEIAGRPREQVESILIDLRDRGLLAIDSDIVDLHPVVRDYAYDRLALKSATAQNLAKYFEGRPVPSVPKSPAELTPVIELVHQLIDAGQVDRAYSVFESRLWDQLVLELSEFVEGAALLERICTRLEERAYPWTEAFDRWMSCLAQIGEDNRVVELMRPLFADGVRKSALRDFSAAETYASALRDAGHATEHDRFVEECISYYTEQDDVHARGHLRRYVVVRAARDKKYKKARAELAAMCLDLGVRPNFDGPDPKHRCMCLEAAAKIAEDEEDLDRWDALLALLSSAAKGALQRSRASYTVPMKRVRLMLARFRRDANPKWLATALTMLSELHNWSHERGLDRKAAEVLLLFCEVHRALGQRDDALQALNACLEIDPRHARALKLRDSREV